MTRRAPIQPCSKQRVLERDEVRVEAPPRPGGLGTRERELTRDIPVGAWRCSLGRRRGRGGPAEDFEVGRLQLYGARRTGVAACCSANKRIPHVGDGFRSQRPGFQKGGSHKLGCRLSSSRHGPGVSPDQSRIRMCRCRTERRRATSARLSSTAPAKTTARPWFRCRLPEGSRLSSSHALTASGSTAVSRPDTAVTPPSPELRLRPSGLTGRPWIKVVFDGWGHVRLYNPNTMGKVDGSRPRSRIRLALRGRVSRAQLRSNRASEGRQRHRRGRKQLLGCAAFPSPAKGVSACSRCMLVANLVMGLALGCW